MGRTLRRQTHLLILATAFRPSPANSFAPRTVEGEGKAGCAPHPRSRVRGALEENAHERTGEAEAVRPSLRNGFNAYAALSLVSGFCHHRPREALAPQELDACSRGARTTRFCVRSRSLRRAFAPEAATSTATCPNVRDVRETPLMRDRMAGIMQVICAENQRK